MKMEMKNLVNLGVVHNCQHVCIRMYSYRAYGGEGGMMPAYYF